MGRHGHKSHIDGDLHVNTYVGAFVKFLLQVYGIIGTDSK